MLEPQAVHGPHRVIGASADQLRGDEGPGLLAQAYEEPHAAAKATLLKRINWERRAAGVRELIRPEVSRRGYREGEDLLFAA